MTCGGDEKDDVEVETDMGVAAVADADASTTSVSRCGHVETDDASVSRRVLRSAWGVSGLWPT